MQRLLKIDDEQVKKIETILKTESMRRYVSAGRDGARYWDVRDNSAYVGDDHSIKIAAIASLHWSGRTALWNEPALQKLFDVLTPAQQRTLTDWLGEPYEGTSWHALRAKSK